MHQDIKNEEAGDHPFHFKKQIQNTSERKRRDRGASVNESLFLKCGRMYRTGLKHVRRKNFKKLYLLACFMEILLCLFYLGWFLERGI